MILHISDFQEGALTEVHHEYKPQDLDVEFIDLKHLKPIAMNGTVEKEHDTLCFQGALTSEIEHICGRCLERVRETFKKEFVFYYEIKDKEIVDATEDVREILILEHSVSYLCREHCRGLCPHCGTNLNEASCTCQDEVKTDSLSSLKDLWQKRKTEKNHGQS